ncbi:MAG: hypothetical protein JSU83_14660 [Deltaproteobacteria bacterium]|nr:MAG: hypothetical protein JSU83_14660 [Deltaproteobacteria bacterium]
MNVNDYCKGVEQELTAWKAKLYDANRKLDQLAGKDKEKILGHLGDLNIIVTEMEDRVEQLRNECPTEWSPVKEEIDDAHVNMRSKYEETMELIGKAAPVSIPG